MLLLFCPELPQGLVFGPQMHLFDACLLHSEHWKLSPPSSSKILILEKSLLLFVRMQRSSGSKTLVQAGSAVCVCVCVGPPSSLVMINHGAAVRGGGVSAFNQLFSHWLLHFFAAFKINSKD